MKIRIIADAIQIDDVEKAIKEIKKTDIEEIISNKKGIYDSIDVAIITEFVGKEEIKKRLN